MNVQNILAVADAIEQHTIPWLGFNMGPVLFNPTFFRDGGGPGASYTIDQTGHKCGTVACIAGWTIALDKKAAEPTSEAEVDAIIGTDFLSTAQKILDLSDDASWRLFFGKDSPVYRDKIPADQAVRTLRHLAATGEVDWTV